MQLKKFHWKKIRNEQPCRFCGSKEHTTGKCNIYTKAGQKRKYKYEEQTERY